MTSSVSEKVIRAGREKAKRDEAINKDVVVNMMSHPSGRRWVWNWLGFCGTFRSSFDREPLLMAFNEGQRNVGQKLLADVMKYAPHSYASMMTENLAEPPPVETQDEEDNG